MGAFFFGATSPATKTLNIIKLGTGADAFIWHDGSDFYLRNYTGNIVIEAKSNEVGIKVIPDGAVELRYDNVKKLETASTGVQITGYLGFESTGKVIHLADSREAAFGTGEDLKIWHDGSNSYIEEAGTGNLMIESNSSISFRDNTGSVDFAKMTNGTGVALYYDNSKTFETVSGGAKVTGELEITSHLDMGDGDFIKLGDGDDLQINHNGTAS